MKSLVLSSPFVNNPLLHHLKNLYKLIFYYQVYVFEDQDFEKTLELIDNTTAYALTGAM